MSSCILWYILNHGIFLLFISWIRDKIIQALFYKKAQKNKALFRKNNIIISFISLIIQICQPTQLFCGFPWKNCHKNGYTGILYVTRVDENVCSCKKLSYASNNILPLILFSIIFFACLGLFLQSVSPTIRKKTLKPKNLEKTTKIFFDEFYFPDRNNSIINQNQYWLKHGKAGRMAIRLN